MNSVRATFANTIRIVHIALWLTIPASLWMWLLTAPAPQPRACEPYCGWYEGNVLEVSEAAFFWIVMILLLVGFLVYACWIAGYCFDVLKRVMAGNRMLPLPHRGYLRQGGELFWYSLGFWAPAIFVFICVSLVFDAIRSEFTVHATWHVIALTLAIMPVILWGNLVGIARYAAFGDRSLICRRWENTRLALTNFIETFVFSSAIFVLVMVCATAISQAPVLLDELQVTDLLAEAAIASFACFFVLLCSSIFSSHVVALYAKWIGIGSNLNHGATDGYSKMPRG